MSQQTTYLGRGEIGGANLVVDKFATVRGKTRRLDPDGSNGNVPYFAGLEIGGTLIVVSSTNIPVTVNLTGPGIATVLSELNAALMPNIRALDDGGCIALQATAAGDAGVIEIRGGSAAAPLGFDMAFGNIYARAGAVSSGPEALVGNSEMSAFINLGESVSSRSVNRALTRIATNTDILHASQKTPTLKLSRIGSLSSGQQTVSGNYGIVTISSLGSDIPDLYTGYGLLSKSSTADELAPFFFLIDNANGQISTCRVVGVGVNGIAGAPPYTDAMVITDAGNVLGQSLRRTDVITITDILEGCIVRAAAGSFSAVREGDLAYFSGASNTTLVPWSNVGDPWVVERKGTEPTGLYDQVQVRPLSLAELKTLGRPSTFATRTSLNTHVDSGQDFGNIRFETGPFVNADIVRVVVSPPITSGHTLRLYAAVRADGVEYNLGDEMGGMAPINQALFQEFVRAVAAEADLAASVVAERNRAMAAEEREILRAQLAEGVLAGLDLSPSQKATLTNGSNADALHTHSNTGAAVNHTHPESDIINLVTDLSNRSLVGHGHAQSEVTGLVAALGGKSNVGHGHGISDISGMATPWSALTGGAASNADAYHTHQNAERMTAGKVYYYKSTFSGGFLGDIGFSLMNGLFTGPIGSSRSVGDGTVGSTLNIYFILLGFTHTSQDGDMWTRVYVTDSPTANPAGVAGSSRPMTCDGNYLTVTQTQGSVSGMSGDEIRHYVPDGANHWIVEAKYSISLASVPSNGVYIYFGARGNGQVDISPHMQDSGISGRYFGLVPPWYPIDPTFHSFWLYID